MPRAVTSRMAVRMRERTERMASAIRVNLTCPLWGTPGAVRRCRRAAVSEQAGGLEREVAVGECGRQVCRGAHHDLASQLADRRRDAGRVEQRPFGGRR